jgi:hypothetical protein
MVLEQEEMFCFSASRSHYAMFYAVQAPEDCPVLGDSVCAAILNNKN